MAQQWINGIKMSSILLMSRRLLVIAHLLKLCDILLMKLTLTTSVFSLCLAHPLMASGLLVTSGLDDPDIKSPFMKAAILCSDINQKNDSDYFRSYLHYKLAVGQSIKQAENSATNAVLAHQQARLQTCNANAKAVTDGIGHAVRDGNGNIVINVP